MQNDVAWRPDRGLDISIESMGSDCLAMKIDARKPNESRVERLTDFDDVERDQIDPDLRTPYYEQRLKRDHSFRGKASMWGEEEANEVLEQLLDYFGRRMPPPPLFLPGCNQPPRYSVMAALELGFSYFQAVVDRKPRRQWRLYEAAATMLRQEYFRGIEEGQRQAFTSTPRPSSQSATVYFIGSATGAIKVGIARNPAIRLKELQTAHPEPLQILATCKGGRDKEREYHKLFADHRLHGEWFRRCPEIEAEIARLTPALQRSRGGE